jgi:hypothetical protein
MPHYSPFPRYRWKIELPSRDNSNFLSPNHHIIITIISKFGKKIKNDMKIYIYHNITKTN